MKIEISIKNNLFDHEIIHWNEFVFTKTEPESNNCSIGNNPVLAEILSKLFNATPVFILIRENGELVGLLQGCLKNGQLYSLPIFSTSGIFVKGITDKLDYYKKIIEAFPKYQVRDFIPMSPYVSSSKVTYYIHLHNTPESQLASFKSKLRSQILKSKSNGLQCSIGDKNHLDTFYSIYARNMHRIGVPVMHKSFYKSLLENYQNGKVNIFLISFEGKIIGGSLTLSYGDFFEVGWASTVFEYNHLGTNMFMYNEMIEYAVKEGMKIFSFGRCSENSSTYQFKKQWQGEFIRIYYNFNYPQKANQQSQGYGIIRKVYKSLPFSLAHGISSRLRKNLINYT